MDSLMKLITNNREIDVCKRINNQVEQEINGLDITQREYSVNTSRRNPSQWQQQSKFNIITTSNAILCSSWLAWVALAGPIFSRRLVWVQLQHMSKGLSHHVTLLGGCSSRECNPQIKADCQVHEESHRISTFVSWWDAFNDSVGRKMINAGQNHTMVDYCHAIKPSHQQSLQDVQSMLSTC